MACAEPQFPHLGSTGFPSGSGLLLRPASYFLDLLSLLPQTRCTQPASLVLQGLGRCDLLPGGLDTQWYLWNKLPSRISNIIFISLVGEPGYLPALLSSTQGERLLLISLGLVRATSQIPRTNPFQGLASGREEMAGPQIQHQWDSRYSFHHTSVLRLYFVILLSDPTMCPLCPPPTI